MNFDPFMHERVFQITRNALLYGFDPPPRTFLEQCHIRAFECAIALHEFADRLTVDQRIAVEIALMSGPDNASLEMIALAAAVLGERT